MLKSQQIQLNISKARTRLNKSISDRNALPETESPTPEMVLRDGRGYPWPGNP